MINLSQNRHCLNSVSKPEHKTTLSINHKQYTLKEFSLIQRSRLATRRFRLYHWNSLILKSKWLTHFTKTNKCEQTFMAWLYNTQLRVHSYAVAYCHSSWNPNCSPLIQTYLTGQCHWRIQYKSGIYMNVCNYPKPVEIRCLHKLLILVRNCKW